ncbi:hypothetical protein CR513_49606, partial [Mucuna pruriens]
MARGGRNDCAIVDALMAVAQAVGNLTQCLEMDWLARFQRNNPPMFCRGYDPDGTQVNWDNFKRLFLEKYFPHDIRNKKQVEFLELKQGDDTVTDYVSKFEALVWFCPTYEGAVNEEAKCVKFISGLRPEIKVYDEDNRARVAHYRSGGSIRDQSKHDSSSKSKPCSRPARNSNVRGGNKGSVQRRSQTPAISQASRGGSVLLLPLSVIGVEDRDIVHTSMKLEMLLASDVTSGGTFLAIVLVQGKPYHIFSNTLLKKEKEKRHEGYEDANGYGGYKIKGQEKWST